MTYPLELPPEVREGREYRTLRLSSTATIELVRVPAGEALLGSSAAERQDAVSAGGVTPQWLEDEQAPSNVKVSEFWMATTEITDAHFGAFVLQTGHRTTAEQLGTATIFDGIDWIRNAPGAGWTSRGFPVGSDKNPAVCLSWEDAQAFCRWLSKSTSLSFRLPTEAEWEYAARAGSTTTFPWGDKLAADSAGKPPANVADKTARTRIVQLTSVDFEDGALFTAPVKSYPANAFGLYDMIGNVQEWVADPYVAGTTTKRTVRGGSFYDAPALQRPATRLGLPATARTNTLGFRVSAD